MHFNGLKESSILMYLQANSHLLGMYVERLASTPVEGGRGVGGCRLT